jgi:hypothetical protein
LRYWLTEREKNPKLAGSVVHRVPGDFRDSLLGDFLDSLKGDGLPDFRFHGTMNMVRYALILVLLGSMGACCATPLGEPDFTTPTNTLLTFHECFKEDNHVREYECFSDQFKKEWENLSLSRYMDMRKIFENEHRVASLLFSLQDLSDNIVEEVPGLEPYTAILHLEVGGQEITIEFICVTSYQIEFDQARPDGGFVEDLYQIAKPEGDEFVIRLPLSGKIQKYPTQLRKVLVERRWLFLDFSFLHEKIDISP